MRSANLTAAGALRFWEHLHASIGTHKQYLSKRKPVYIVSRLVQSIDGRKEDGYVCITAQS